MSRSRPADALSCRLNRIQQLTVELAWVRDDAVEQHALSERIPREIVAAKLAPEGAP